MIICGQVQAAMLYDSTLATVPSAQGWGSYLIEGGISGMDSGAYVMDTRSDSGIHAFHIRSDQTLDTMTGFSLNLDLRIDAESHSNPNRAGFSFITIGQDTTKAIEVAFWEDRVWVYDYSTGVFSKRAEYMVDTRVRRNYQLQVANQQFSLFVDGILGINGAMVDYSAFGMPYNMPSTLIFGDDTTSGASSVEIYNIQAVPLPSALILLTSGMVFLGYSGNKNRKE